MADKETKPTEYETRCFQGKSDDKGEWTCVAPKKPKAKDKK